jgi:TPR repeat protein
MRARIDFRSILVLTGALIGLAGGAAAQEDENPTTPGAIPSPSTYQGSMELQRQSDQQDQQFRQQQQQTYSQPTYNAPSSTGAPSAGWSSPRPPAEAQRTDAGQSQEAATPESLAASAANDRGDYAEAVRIWRLMAARGSADAAYNLGVNYDEGHGVPQDRTAALEWYQKAAAQGMGQAMGNIAVLYVERSESPENLIQAYKWTSLAINHEPEAQRGPAVKNRDLIGSHLTRSQIEQALTLARAWEAAHPKAATYLKPENPTPSGPADAQLTLHSYTAGPGWRTPMSGAMFWIMGQNPTPVLATFGSASNPLDQLAADCRAPNTCSRDFKALTAKALSPVKTDAAGQGQWRLAAGRYYLLGAGAYQGKLVFWFRQVDVQSPQTSVNLDQTDGLVAP